MSFRCTRSFTIVAALLISGNAFSQEEHGLSSESLQFFESKIRPVLVEQCYRCHSIDGQGVRGGLSVDNRDALLAGGESGPAIVPGNLEESLLWSAINYQDYKMPPKNPLPKSVIEDFRKWIEMGAPDPRINSGVVVHSKVTPDDIERGRQFWSFKLPVATKAPAGSHSQWVRSDIDRFVAAKWDEHDLGPAADAEPTTLLRRIFFDLIGMPPSLEQLDAFVAQWNENQDQAIARVVDELLERPQFGERWGRHWLDVARYAESAGKEVDATFPNAWRYRNYVIDAFNADKPYDQFVREQIAGDLIPAKNDQEFAEHLIATGFLTLGPKALIERNPRQFQADLVDEQIDTTTRVILGVSVACARCHDHKFDPIPQTDYYALAGIFQSTETLFGGTRTLRNRQPSNLIILPIDDPNPNDKPLSPSELADLKKQLEERRQEAVEAQRAFAMKKKGETSPQKTFASRAILDQTIAQLNNRIHSVDSHGKPQTFCMGVQDTDRPRNAKLLVRGEIDQPAQEVKRGLVQVLCQQPIHLPAANSGRRELAQWLASRDNPLTARVMVNRIWQHLIGNPIVRETENFGASGPAPSHPELLDNLAIAFMDHDWSTKQMVRSIMNSRVYRLSSGFDKERFEKDPDNHYLAHANVRRLDAEAIRDAMLTMSQQIDLKRPKASLIASYGSTVIGPNGPMGVPGGVMNLLSNANTSAGRTAIKNVIRNGARNGNSNPLEATNYFRSVYLPVARNALPRALDVFDFAEPSLVIGTREASNTSDQALYMLNNPFVIEQSDALARRIMGMASRPNDRIAKAFAIVYGRPATQKELRAATEFFRKVDDGKGNGSRDQKLFQALSQFCQALFCSAEFRLLN